MGGRQLGVEAVMVAYSTLPERSQENEKREGRGGVGKHHAEFKSLVILAMTRGNLCLEDTMPSDPLWSFWVAARGSLWL